MTNTSSSPTRRHLLQASIGAGLGELTSCTSSQLTAPTTTRTETDSKTVTVSPDNRYVFTPGTENPQRIAPGTTVRSV